LIEEKRKQAMDMHLNFIVDQTEKYSSWLIESLATNAASNNVSTVVTVDTSNLVNDVNGNHQLEKCEIDVQIAQQTNLDPSKKEEGSSAQLEAISTKTESIALDEDDADVEFDETKLKEESDDESTIEKEELLEVILISFLRFFNLI
jgi:hypothetical protein